MFKSGVAPDLILSFYWELFMDKLANDSALRLGKVIHCSLQ